MNKVTKVKVPCTSSRIFVHRRQFARARRGAPVPMEKAAIKAALRNDSINAKSHLLRRHTYNESPLV